jgi:hypothetical protein
MIHPVAVDARHEHADPKVTRRYASKHGGRPVGLKAMGLALASIAERPSIVRIPER